MTDRPPEASDERQGREREAAALLSQALQRARWAMFWERLWPALATLATAVGLFLAVSWIGLWLWLSPIPRAVGVLAFGVLICAAAVPLVFVRFPSRSEALRRLDRFSGIVHRPATAMADRMANAGDDPLSVALWRAHMERMIAAARALRPGLPAPDTARRDPFALRAAVLVVLLATFFAAGGEHWRRIGAAFDWHGVVTPANFRVDAWVTPPAYTAKPPLLLPGLRASEPTQTAGADPFSVPIGSTVVVRSTGATQFNITARGGLKEGTDGKPAAAGSKPAAAGSEEHRYTVTGDGIVSASTEGRTISWGFAAIPDKPPRIALTKDPKREARGSLRLQYKVEDDYGVVGAKAVFARKPADQKVSDAKPLFPPPEMPLSLPQARARNGTGQTIKDLTEHPWAGSTVVMTLAARDDAGNEGYSEPRELVLPERTFTKPLARALIEQRRDLALDRNARGDVLVALDALSLAPDKFGMKPGVYLGLRTIYWQLGRAKSDDDLREVVGRLWQMAVDIEDGNLSDVEKQLRAAEDALRQALERGASDQEIKKLMDQLRAALDRYMQALAEQLRRNPQQAMRPLDRNARMLRPQDLRNMLNRMENMARSGNRDAARQMLEQLQAMLDNLQMARPGQGQNGDDQMMQALDQLGDMIRRQQQLRDRTFRQGQDRREGSRGQRGQFGDLQRNQQALREQLDKLMQQLRQRGFGQQQGEEGQQGQQGQEAQQGDGMGQLGEAGKEMGSAEGQLGEGDADRAVGSQGRALEALRRGAQGMAQAMQQGQGPGQGQPGRLGRARADQEPDPLGRPLRGRDYGDDSTVKVPGEIEVQRARRILEELRRRFGETRRPQIELDYLDRLLKGFE